MLILLLLIDSNHSTCGSSIADNIHCNQPTMCDDQLAVYVHMYAFYTHFLKPSCAQTLSHSHKYVCMYSMSVQRSINSVASINGVHASKCSPFLSLRARKISLSALFIIFRFIRNYFIVSRTAAPNLKYWGAVVLGCQSYWMSVDLIVVVAIFFLCSFFCFLYFFVGFYFCILFLLLILLFSFRFVLSLCCWYFYCNPFCYCFTFNIFTVAKFVNYKIVLVFLFVELISTLVSLLVNFTCGSWSPHANRIYMCIYILVYM